MGWRLFSSREMGLLSPHQALGEYGPRLVSEASAEGLDGQRTLQQMASAVAFAVVDAGPLKVQV
jgi:hypothetical protein